MPFTHSLIGFVVVAVFLLSFMSSLYIEGSTDPECSAQLMFLVSFHLKGQILERPLLTTWIKYFFPSSFTCNCLLQIASIIHAYLFASILNHKHFV